MRPPEDAGRIIRVWRERIGLTQEGLADALYVTFSTVSRWENGHVKPSNLAWKAVERVAAEHGSVLPGEHAPVAALLDHERTELRMPEYVAAGVGARRDDLHALPPGVREDGVGQPGGEVPTAERRRRPRVPHVQGVAAPFVDELGLDSVDTNEESPGLVLDLDVHRAQRDRRASDVKPSAWPSGPARR
jgi:putative transcriptional regulator